MSRLIGIVLVGVLLVGALPGCALYLLGEKAHDVTPALVGGQLKAGMSEAEVRSILGAPAKTAMRQTATDQRAVWTYRKRALTQGYLAAGLITVGFFYLLPPPFEEHFIIFSNGALVGWDLPDPYAPDLIIEQRIR